MVVFKYALTLSPALIRALPQSTIDDLPSCAHPPLLSALSGTSCANTDMACICAQTGRIPTITSPVVAACPGTVSADHVAAFIAQLCGEGAASSVSSSVAVSVTSAANMTQSTSLPSTAMANSTATAANAANATRIGALPTTNGTSPREPTATPSIQPSDGGEQGVRMSLMAGVVAFGGLTWAFAEL